MGHLLFCLFSQGNRSTSVPAEMIVPSINSEGKIVHLVASGNAMKQGWLWEVWYFSSFFFFFLPLPHSLILSLNQIFLFGASEVASYALDTDWLSFISNMAISQLVPSFILNHVTPHSGAQHRSRRCEAGIRTHQGGEWVWSSLWRIPQGTQWYWPYVVEWWQGGENYRIQNNHRCRMTQAQAGPEHPGISSVNYLYIVGLATWNEKLLLFRAYD